MSHPSDLASPEQLLIASLPALDAYCPWQRIGFLQLRDQLFLLQLEGFCV